MKKFLSIISIILLTFLLIGCKCENDKHSDIGSSIEFYKNYSSLEKDSVIKDIYKYLTIHQIDSIPLNDWRGFSVNIPDGLLIQRFLRKIENENSSYTFMFNEYLNVDTVWYEFKIRHDRHDNIKH